MGKTIGFLLFQYRLVKTRRVLLWDYISLRWMISTITSKVYGCYGSTCNRLHEVNWFSVMYVIAPNLGVAK